MADKVNTAHLLEFIAKAQKVSPEVNVREVEDGYDISIYADWNNDDNFYHQSVFIAYRGDSADFYEMSCEVDYLVRLEEERENKRNKLQEVLSRLTDEEKEILGYSF